METSESEEEEFLDRAMAQAREKSPLCEDSGSAIEDVEEDEESAIKDVEEDEEVEHMESEEEARPDDTGEEDEGDSEDEGDAGPAEPQKPRKKRPRKKTFNEPDSDNDPDPPSVYQDDHAPEEVGWTRTLENITIKDFKGKKPNGPTFKKKKSPIN